jgi:L-ascorbate metabolism protein UlaG (beta-lactamase superfamily)
MWWDEHTINRDGRVLKITFLPALHWSARFSLASYRASLWGSWMIESNNFFCYFAGDTAYGPHFKEIAHYFPKIDVALMPIGPTYEQGGKKSHSHVNAQEAIDAFVELKAQCFVPMHYGTVFVSKDMLINPLQQMQAYWKEQPLCSDKQLLHARCGQLYAIEQNA